MSARGSAGRKLNVGQAIALGALHGPAELLPISSSGHVALIPWLLHWDYDQLDDELRKSFEVVVHAGTAAALLITLRDEVDEAVRGLNARRLALIALSFAPPAVVGYSLERPIERRFGTPPTIAAALVIGAIAMAWSDRAAQERTHSEAGAADALWLGIAQACALVPGISRNGATLAAARARRFTREDANRLSRHAALPVIAGATALKGWRLKRRGLPPLEQRALEMWEHVMTHLEDDPLKLRTEVDWVIKYHMIEAYRKRHDLPLTHPRVALLDLSYHDVTRARSLYYLLERRGRLQRTVHDSDIDTAVTTPPQTTRARLRGAFIKRAKERKRDYTVDWVHLKLNDQAQRTVLCKDPFKARDDRVERLISSL